MTPGECVRVRVAVPDAPGFCPPSLTVQVSQTKDSLILGEPALGTGCLPKVVGFHPELGLAPPFKSAHCSPIPQSAQGLASAYKPSPSANHSTHLHPTTRQLVNHPQTQLPSPRSCLSERPFASFFLLPSTSSSSKGRYHCIETAVKVVSYRHLHVDSRTYVATCTTLITRPTCATTYLPCSPTTDKALSLLLLSKYIVW